MMKVKINALNKDYLVEFKSDTQFMNFLTQHNDKINNIEMLEESSTLPALEKTVELPTISKPTGWKTLEKSSFNTKETGVDKKCMTLGGKYGEFKYEPDKTLDGSFDNKVSTPKSDSPALSGDEPKVTDVEATSKETSVKAKYSSQTEENKEEKTEENKEEKKEDVKESVEDNSVSEDEQKDYDDDFEKTHECSWCGEEFSESEMRCEKDMGWLCNHDWRYLDSREGDLEEVDPSDVDLDETDKNEDYEDGYEEGKFAYESGNFISPEERNDLVGDSESEEFWRGYYDGYESAKEGLDDSEEELDEDTDPITRNPHKGDDIVSYAKSSMWRPEDEDLEESFKDGLKKVGKFAKNTVAGAAVAGSLMTANPSHAQISPDGTNSTDGYLQAVVDDESEYGEDISPDGTNSTDGYLQPIEENIDDEINECLRAAGVI